MSLLMRRRMLLSQQKKSSNLFDTNRFVENAIALGTPSHRIKVIESGIELGQTAYQEETTKIDFGFEAGKQYAISFNAETIEINGTATVWFYFNYDDGTRSGFQYVLKEIGNTERLVYTSNVGKNVIAFSAGHWSYKGAVRLTNIMLNEGAEPLPYEPYEE